MPNVWSPFGSTNRMPYRSESARSASCQSTTGSTPGNCRSPAAAVNLVRVVGR